jgi:ABC-type glycerol-3-phosphate transport system substrate-binding protein
MPKHKRWTGLVALVLLVSILTSACGSTPKPAAPTAAPTAAQAEPAEPTAAPQAEVRTVVYLSAGTADVEQDWNEKWVKEFNDTHDDIQIQYELVSWADLLPKTAAMIAAGTPPDIAWYAPSQIKEWYLGGLLEPLDDWIKEDLDEQLEPIKNPASSDIYYDGHYYGLPFCLAGRGLVVRKDILTEAGYNPDDLFNWDWDKYKEIAAAVTKPPEQFAMDIPFGEPRITAGYATPALMLTNGLKDLTDFSNRDAYIESLQMIKDMFPYTPPAQVTWKHADGLTAYMNGVVAMHSTGSFFYGDIKRQAPDIMSEAKTATLPFPRGPRLDAPVVPWYTVGWVMFKASENKEAAAEVLHFLGAKEAVNEWPMNMAPRVGITMDDRIRVSEFGEDLRWWLDDWQTMMETAIPVQRPGYAPSTEIDQIFNEELLRLYNDEISVEECYDNLKARIEPIVITE